MERIWRVEVYADSLDPNPIKEEFTLFNEVEDFISEEVARRVQWEVDHSPYEINEEERANLEEQAHALINILEV